MPCSGSLITALKTDQTKAALLKYPLGTVFLYKSLFPKAYTLV